MRKLFLLSVIGLLSLTGQANAQTVSTTLAQRLAETFWNNHRPVDTKPASTVTVLPFSELQHLHVFSINGQGFVIVAGDERVRPILAYSFDSPFPEELNPEVGYWLHGYDAQIAEVSKSDAPQDKSIQQQWQQLICSPYSDEPVGTLQDIPAMLTTRWDQGDPFNILCPYDSIRHARTVVGCVATAMAQIMKYWNYPSFGEGAHSYVPYNRHSSFDFGVLSVDFENTTYLWQFMPNTLSSYTPTYQKNATATISYHCGVAVDMMYGSSSSAYSSCGFWASACATDAFWQYFKYDSSLYHADRYDYDDSTWISLINNDIYAHRPIYYSGHDSTGGHAFIFDGADLEGRYHVNWGWGGYGDGFYSIDDLAPRSGGYGGNATYTFNYSQGAIFGIKPRGVETFDTVDYYDTICDNYQYIDFREYHLQVAEMDTLLRHLDTIFNYHLTIMGKKRVLLDPNYAGGETRIEYFCPATGYTFPEPTFRYENHSFIGWCHSATGDDYIYQPGQHIDLRTTRTFYALWLSDSSEGISEIDDSEILKIYPNPTSDELTISLSMGHAAQILVIDALGRTLLQENYPSLLSGNSKISLKELPAGLYTLQIKTATGTFNRHIIKQ